MVQMEVVAMKSRNVHEAVALKVNSTSCSSTEGSVVNAVGADAGFQCADLQAISATHATCVWRVLFYFYLFFAASALALREDIRGGTTTLFDMAIIVFGIMWNHHNPMSGVLIASK